MENFDLLNNLEIFKKFLSFFFFFNLPTFFISLTTLYAGACVEVSSAFAAMYIQVTTIRRGQNSAKLCLKVINYLTVNWFLLDINPSKEYHSSCYNSLSHTKYFTKCLNDWYKGEICGEGEHVKMSIKWCFTYILCGSTWVWISHPQSVYIVPYRVYEFDLVALC